MPFGFQRFSKDFRRKPVHLLTPIFSRYARKSFVYPFITPLFASLMHYPFITPLGYVRTYGNHLLYVAEGVPQRGKEVLPSVSDSEGDKGYRKQRKPKNFLWR